MVRWFWEVVEEELSWTDTLRLLLFWSGSPQPPLNGFAPSDEDGNWSLQRLAGDTGALPQASTCETILMFPEYASKQVLRQKLATALELGYRGFSVV